MIKKGLTILFCFFGLATIAQQDAMFTHYSFNTLAVNPAFAGSRNVLSATALHRSQWVGFDGAPNSQNVSIHSPLLGGNLGAGLSLTNDMIGPTTTTGVFADIAGRIKLGTTSRLSAGIKIGMNMRSSRLAELQVQQAGDPNFSSNIQSEVLPNIGFGVYYNSQVFFLGFGAPRLLKSQIDGEYTGMGNEKNFLERHFYVTTGGTIRLKKDESLKLRPSASFRFSYGARPQLDLTALFYIDEKIWVGPMFRWYDAIGIIGGIKITDQFSAGYSFDWSMGMTTGKYNGGSHELMLRYDFVFHQKGKIQSPRKP